MSEGIEEPKNLLVLCVDRDDDIGSKTGLSTPLIGRKSVFDAAVKLIATDPEEADANTMFESIRILDSLPSTSRDERYEVAVVAGTKSGEFEADRKIAMEIQKIMKLFPADAAILVSDGFTDQAVAPIVESYLPIVSVHRFAVRHSEALEMSWYIFIRYLRSFFSEPRYTKWTLGLPGFTLIVLTVLYSLSIFYPNFPFAAYTSISILLIFGLALVIKGFEIDKAMSSLFSEVVSVPYVLVNAFGSVAGIVVCLLGINQGLSNVVAKVPSWYLNDLISFLSHTNLIVAAFLDGSIDFFIIGVSIVFIGRTLYFFFKKSARIWPNSIGVVASIMIGETLRRSSPILREVPTNLTNPLVIDFFIWIALGTIILILCIFGMRKLRSRYMERFPRY